MFDTSAFLLDWIWTDSGSALSEEYQEVIIDDGVMCSSVGPKLSLGIWLSIEATHKRIFFVTFHSNGVYKDVEMARL